MLIKKVRGAAPTATPENIIQARFYPASVPLSNRINKLLTGLLFVLQIPHLSASERTTILECIDGLLRLKIDLGLVNEVRHAS